MKNPWLEKSEEPPPNICTSCGKVQDFCSEIFWIMLDGKRVLCTPCYESRISKMKNPWLKNKGKCFNKLAMRSAQKYAKT